MQPQISLRSAQMNALKLLFATDLAPLDTDEYIETFMATDLATLGTDESLRLFSATDLAPLVHRFF